MRHITIPAIWLACFLNVTTLTEGARILAIITVPSYSHQIPFQSLWASLSQRGHQVVVLTTDPIGDPSLTNLTEIDFRHHYNIFKKIDFAKLKFTDTWLTITRNYIWDNFEELVKSIFEHPEVRKLYAPNSGEHFDVIFVEVLMSPAIYALAHRFNAPIIGIASLPLFANNHYNLGSPVLPSHPSTWEMEYSTGFNLSLWQRMKNFIRLWYHVYLVFNYFMPHQQALAEKYLGKDLPDINEMEKNISIILCNQQEVTSFVRPQPMNLIQFGSFHIMKKTAPLPNDLKKFLDNTPNGFIYVSLGTNIKITSLPKHLQHVFYDVFANLPCKVVWKFEEDLTDKPDNIYIAKWLPQQSILGHPNIRLFVYQGGLQSTEEAVRYAVPLLGMPMLADQSSQVNKMVSIGVAKKLFITDLSVKKLNSSIMDIITDKSLKKHAFGMLTITQQQRIFAGIEETSKVVCMILDRTPIFAVTKISENKAKYKERMLYIKALSEDRPYDMLKNVIWWTEFVIRHKGAPHLRTSIVHESWYERYDVDVIAILSIAFFIILVCALVITYKLLKIIFKCLCAKEPVDIKKKTI